MGQRSQIFIRYNANKEKGTENTYTEKHLMALYFGWNYGERMISRAAGLVGWIKEHENYRDYEFQKLPIIASVNFDMRDYLETTDLIKEYIEYGKNCDTLNGYIFNEDNNDGKLLIDLSNDGKIKYAFLDYDNEWLGDAESYYEWDCHGEVYDIDDDETRKYTCRNADFLNNTDGVELMSAEEAEAFLSDDYTSIKELEK